MAVLRRVGLLLLSAGLLFLGMATVSGTASAADPAYNASLKAAHVGATNPGFGTGECPQAGWGWHFVLQGNDTTFLAVRATFETAGQITAFVSHPTAKHAYVFTPGPDKLLGAVAEVDGPDREFNLSHVCTGPQVSPTTSTTSTTTSTIAPEIVSTSTSTTHPVTTTSTTQPAIVISTSTTHPPAETTSTTHPVTTTSTHPPVVTTTEPAEVLGITTTIVEPTSTTEAVHSTSTTEAVVVLAANTSAAPTLPRTGSETRSLAMTGFALLLLGGVLLARSRTLTRS